MSNKADSVFAEIVASSPLSTERKFWQEMLRQWGMWGLLGLSLGGSYRGLQGLRQLSPSGEFLPPENWLNNLPRPYPMPVAEDNPKSNIRKKSAESWLARQWKNLLESSGQRFWEALFGGFDWRQVKYPQYHAFYLPGAAMAMGTGLYGGWKLSDLALDEVRRRQVDQELEEAREQYRKALLGKLSPSKKASRSQNPSESEQNQTESNQLGDPLEQLYKQALSLAQVNGSLWGLYLLGSALAALGAGRATYDFIRKREAPKLLEKARVKRLNRAVRSGEVPILFSVGSAKELEKPEEKIAPNFTGVPEPFFLLSGSP